MWGRGWQGRKLEGIFALTTYRQRSPIGGYESSPLDLGGFLAARQGKVGRWGRERGSKRILLGTSDCFGQRRGEYSLTMSIFLSLQMMFYDVYFAS